MRSTILSSSMSNVNKSTASSATSSEDHKMQYVTDVRDNFPIELQSLLQWVLWRLEKRKGAKPDEKPTKVPYSVNGGHAKSNDRATWASFDAACNAYLRGSYSGVGFVFCDDDPYTGVDMDSCIEDGIMDPQRLVWVRNLDSYTEYSQSETGIHTILLGTLPERPDGKRSGYKSPEHKIEMYDSLRFFAVTGKRMEGTPATVNSRQDQLLALHHEVFAQVRKMDGKPVLHTPLPLNKGIPQDDQELLDIMFDSKNGYKIRSLWNGDISAHSNDESAADLALCNHLAFWTDKDASRMDSLFRQSGLMRDKWDEKRPGGTWGSETIDKAIRDCSETYKGKRRQEDDQDGSAEEAKRRFYEKHPGLEAEVEMESDGDGDTDSDTPSAKSGKSKGNNKPTQVFKLAMKNCEIFMGTDGIVYASATVGDHTETIKVRSMRFRQYLGNLFYQKTGSVAGKSACEEAVELLAFQGEKVRETYMRIAGNEDDIYIDLGNDKWQAIKVTASGWEITDKAPVAFRRTSKMRQLPLPVKEVDHDAALNELFSLINVAPEDRVLVLAWLLSAMCPKGPYPILTLVAEAGSAKTTTAKALKRLVSPYVAETRSRPKTVEDVYVAAQNDWVLIYDNLSSIPIDISDAFCRLSTGGGYATRELYENMEEVATDQQQPLIINGISDIIKKGDLMSRALVVSCPEIPQDKRVEESEWERKFGEASPRIMGALLDILSAVLQELPTIKLDAMPRMADFAKLGAALDKAVGIVGEPMSFTSRYMESIAQGTMSVIEQSPIYRPLYKFMKHHGAEWTGTATTLLEEIRKHATDIERIDLPTLNTKLSGAISEIAPNLRLAHIMDVRRNKSNGNRTITITPMKAFASGEPETGTVQGR